MGQCHGGSKSNKRLPTSLDLKAMVVRLGDCWQVSGRSTDSLDCLRQNDPTAYQPYQPIRTPAHHLPSSRKVKNRIYYTTLSGRIGKVVASHAAVAHSIPAEVALIYTLHKALRGNCP